MCGFLRAKGFHWFSPVGHIKFLVLASIKFDCAFVMTFQGHSLVHGKNGARFEINFVFNKGLRPVSQIMNFSENELPRKDCTSSFLTYGEAGKLQANFSKVFKVLSTLPLT